LTKFGHVVSEMLFKAIVEDYLLNIKHAAFNWYHGSSMRRTNGQSSIQTTSYSL